MDLAAAGTGLMVLQVLVQVFMVVESMDYTDMVVAMEFMALVQVMAFGK